MLTPEIRIPVPVTIPTARNTGIVLRKDDKTIIVPPRKIEKKPKILASSMFASLTVKRPN